MADEDTEKTEEASERKRSQFREEGKVATSKELLAAVSMVVGGAALLAAGGMFGDGLHSLITVTRAIARDGELLPAELDRLGITIYATMGPPLLLVLAAASLPSALVGVLVTSFNVSTDALEPKFERLNPITNAQNAFFSKQPWVQLLKASTVALCIGWASWACARDHMDALPVLANLDARGQLSFLVELAWDLLKRVAPVAIAVGAADFGWQKFSMSQDMMMTKEEVKKEHKEQEGDPLIKAKRRARQRQLASGKMLQRVKDADVVVVNPTHYAVALRYRKEEGAAPIVVARGLDHLALKIRAEAGRHEIPIIENRPLARGLYARSKLGLAIPAEFYAPVAQLLAVVFRERARRAR